MSTEGTVSRVAGPFILAKGMMGARMFELVRVGDSGVIGEIIRLQGEQASIQTYEDTTGIKPGETVVGTGRPLSIELGPGLMGEIFDGIQRPLPVIQELIGPRIQRGMNPDALSRTKRWHFTPSVKNGVTVQAGASIGMVRETALVDHHILVPPEIHGGTLTEVAPEGEYTVTDPIAEVTTADGVQPLFLMHSWPVRKPRPFKTVLATDVPLVTGTRIIDSFFPLTKGGTAMIPGGFGTGKTVLLQSLANRADADIVILVGCGERGNEMADVVERFPKIMDFRTGNPIMNRTIIIANTSDMPIAAREASIYTATTMAEYYRDMGYNVLLMVDSTSRWAEALREISGRLEEMPGEEGYPAYLASRLSEFYARAGRVETFNEVEGSISIIGAVSPPGGDFSEPVTRSTLRLARVFWALDFALAHRRHYPAINWLMSHSEYAQMLEAWYEKVGPGWSRFREGAMSLLREEEELREIVSLVGAEILGDQQRAVFEMAKILREYYLLQDSYHPIDRYCASEKSYHMLRLILKFSTRAREAVESGVPLADLLTLEVREDLERMKIVRSEDFGDVPSTIEQKIDAQFDHLLSKAKEAS